MPQDSPKTRLQIALRAILWSSLYLVAIATFFYVLAVLDDALVRANHRNWEWLVTAPVLALAFVGIGTLYFFLLAVFTALAELLPRGAAKRKVMADLEQTGTLDARLARLESLRGASIRNLLDAPTWAPRFLLSALKFSALAVLIVVGVVACVAGASNLVSSLAGAPAWAIVIIVLLIMVLAK